MTYYVSGTLLGDFYLLSHLILNDPVRWIVFLFYT